MIVTKGITKAYGKLVAVNNLDLMVKKGSIHGFVGPNGAGKSTTIKLLVGAIRQNSGDGFIKGYPVGSVEARRIVGYSPERPCFYKDMTAWDYVVYMAGLSGMEASKAGKRANELLDWLELSDFSNAKIGGFSAGMKQRLSLAQAMAHKPELLILDEPTANLDPSGRISLLEKLKSLPTEESVTIFISSHILSELEYLIDTVTIIDRGRAIAENSMRLLKQQISQNHYVLNTSDNKAVMEAMRGNPAIGEMRIDNDGIIRITSQDTARLQAAIMEAVVKSGALLKHFGEEQVRLEDIYQRTIH